MVSSVPKPPQRIRVEMPAEIAPQPVPETLLTHQPEEENAVPVPAPVSSKIHVIHPKKVEEEPRPPVEQLETEAALAVSAEPASPVDESALVAESALPADEPVLAEPTPSDDEPSPAEPALPAAEPSLVSNGQEASEYPGVSNETEVEMEATISAAAVTSVPSDEELHQKQYYTIGEVADMFGANQSQIRFWENEFEILQPKKSKKGDRLFRPEDVKNLVLIRHLLQERRFTIEGAKEYLKGKSKRLADRHQTIQQLEKLKGFLLEMRATLGEPAV